MPHAQYTNEQHLADISKAQPVRVGPTLLIGLSPRSSKSEEYRPLHPKTPQRFFRRTGWTYLSTNLSITAFSKAAQLDTTHR